ncbi:hypothetical protein Tco_0304196 [Tanacetum coccineum]
MEPLTLHHWYLEPLPISTPPSSAIRISSLPIFLSDITTKKFKSIATESSPEAYAQTLPQPPPMENEPS